MKKRQLDDHIRNQWDKLYRNEKESQPIQKDIPGLVNVFKKYNVNRILDLGCGSGRHTIYLVGEGFDVYGFDISEQAINKTRSSLQAKGLNAHLFVGSMYEQLPFEDNFFDAVICIRVLHHGTIDNIRGAISEIERVLKPGGFVYVTVRKRISKEKRLRHKYIAPRTYVPLEGNEKGVVHYLFNKELFRKEFKNFKILELRIDYGPQEWEAYYSLLGRLREMK